MKTKSLFVLLAFSLSSCHLGRFVIYNFADIDDYKKFPQTEIKSEGTPFYFQQAENAYDERMEEIKLTTEELGEVGLTEYLDKGTSTVAFIVIKSDSILYEKYFEEYDEESIVTSFSVAKSYVSALVGIAKDEGFIKNVEEPITNYIPELLEKDPRFEAITIKHLLDMRSGLKFNENSYTNPFAEIAKLYYGRDHLKQVINTKIEEPAGTTYEYQSINTEILAIIVERATTTPLASYFEAKIWQPIGMEYDASWNIDSKKNQTPKAFCCLNARARDFAKLGRLYLKEGNWEGQQLISKDWIERSVQPDFENGCYQYQWYSEESTIKNDDGQIKYFVDSLSASQETANSYQRTVASTKNLGQYYVNECGPAFMAIGILGQFIYVDPEQELVMVRFGKKNDSSYPYLFKRIGELLKEVDAL
ncbi:MAG: CubicO group peptidase (beta-lactamase class C family) [Marivirga sp.]|jgi:CubicO group peptidase (beta-lactamase class C family)